MPKKGFAWKQVLNGLTYYYVTEKQKIDDKTVLYYGEMPDEKHVKANCFSLYPGKINTSGMTNYTVVETKEVKDVDYNKSSERLVTVKLGFNGEDSSINMEITGISGPGAYFFEEDGYIHWCVKRAAWPFGVNFKIEFPVECVPGLEGPYYNGPYSGDEHPIFKYDTSTNSIVYSNGEGCYVEQSNLDDEGFELALMWMITPT